MSGFRIVHNTSGSPAQFPVVGVKVTTGGRVRMGNVQVLDFSGVNVLAESGGVVIADGTFSNNAQLVGAWPGQDSTTYGNNWMAMNNGVIQVANANPTVAYRQNFTAETGGVIRMQNCLSIGAPILSRRFGVIHAFQCTSRGVLFSEPGFWANEGGQVSAVECTSGANGSVNYVGYKSESGSKMFIYNSTAAYNTTHGFQAETGSTITGRFNSSSNNTNYGYFVGNFCYIEQVTGGSANGTALSNITAANTTKMSMVG